MKTLEQIELEAEASLALCEQAIEAAKNMIDCIETLAPETYLQIREEIK